VAALGVVIQTASTQERPEKKEIEGQEDNQAYVRAKFVLDK